MTRRLLLGFIVALLVGFGLLPVLSMFGRSIFVDGQLSLAAYGGLLQSTRQWTLMRNSLALSALVTLLTVVTGTPLGILLGKTDLPGRQFLAMLFVTPLLVPPYIFAVSWFDLLGPDGRLAGLSGCTFILFSIFLPIPMLLTMVFLRTVNPRLEEAGRLCAAWPTVLARITIPLILPGVLLAGLLVFLLSFGEFSVPNFLRFDVFPVESFTRFSAFYDFKAATAAVVPLAGVTLILLFVEAVFLRDRTYLLRPSATPERSPVIALGPHRKWLFALVTAAGFLIVVLPVVVLVSRSAGHGNYAEALRRAGGSLGRSFAFAVGGASLLTVFGFFTGYLVQTRALRCWRAVDSLTVFLFALPGIVIGIGLISLWNTPRTNLVYGTSAIIIIGYLAKYTALTSRIMVTQLAQIPPTMAEAAQVAGAGWLRRLALIQVPLARRGLLAGWLIGYIFCLRDTDITMLVYPPGRETLPVRIFTLMANGSPGLIAALCVIMIAAAVVPIGLLWLVSGLRQGKVVE